MITLKLTKRDVIAKRIAQELKDGDSVNLGVGIPTLVAKYIGDKKVYLQSENGLLGIGPPPNEDELDIDLIDAGKNPVSIMPDASYFDSAFSFGMIRGHHIDVAVLGTLEVDRYGEIANWSVPNQPILGVGGAMDLVAGAKKVIVASTLFTKDGSPKLVESLTLDSSGERLVNQFVTEYASFTFEDGKIFADDIYGDMTFEELQDKIGLPLTQK
ncbi:3-oxoacid CoA-transferase subunit B [Sporosarcina sp. FSL W7-1283]|uniref:3-oxoacid CoA-transferase subunit B n=1 Tax=Sporosarcina sp. FSL W7-1283 TaxID=2921560 RepID=UPI001116E897|nr:MULTISPECIES: 3-oxoacid CoA-transferase subunit B [Sporosarcina]MBY0221808.1 3-oxoacid CoA-transferase subunit B [Sporosarcina aquimarina]